MSNSSAICEVLYIHICTLSLDLLYICYMDIRAPPPPFANGLAFSLAGLRKLTRSRYDFRNKRVGVIGNGSSSIQIVPSLQPVEGVRMTVFMRSPTWISSNAFGDSAMTALGLDPEGCKSDPFPNYAFISCTYAWGNVRVC